MVRIAPVLPLVEFAPILYCVHPTFGGVMNERVTLVLALVDKRTSYIHVFCVCKKAWMKERQILCKIIDNCRGEHSIRCMQT